MTAIPSTGSVSFSQIAQVVYNNSTNTLDLNNTDIRYLLGAGGVGTAISLSAARGKPAATSYSYTTAGTYTLAVPPYQTMTLDVRGAGQGGNGGTGSQTCTGWCGQYCFFPYCCNGYGGVAGSSGAASYYRVSAVSSPTGSCPAIDVTGNGGSSSGAGSGYGGTVTTGGGGAGGAAGYAEGCSGSAGTVGNAGGRVTASFTKAVNGPAYGASATIVVGAGGAGGSVGGGTGGAGAVYFTSA